jgi:quercetin dioxygenase-like cupin family protein
MNKLKSVARLVALLFLAGSASVRAQDPAVVNADTIHVTLENTRVRVLEAKLPPGAKEKLHSHPAYVVYVIEGGKVRNHAADGATSESELVAGATLYRDPLTHWAENIGKTTIHLILVELKEAR